MAYENYDTLIRNFNWSEVDDALDWSAGQKVSLGNAIIDRHVDSDRTALLSVASDGSEKRLSYRQLSEESNRFANLLIRLGVSPGDRIGGLMPRGPEVLIAIIGSLKAGAIYVPIFTGFGPESIRFRLDNCQAKYLVTHENVLMQLPRDLTPQLIVVASDKEAVPEGAIDLTRALSCESKDFDCILRKRNDPAAIIYTSGSTGQPKGGVLAVNFLAAVWPYITYGLELKHDDILWPTGDPGWGYGFVCYLGALAVGATVVTIEENPNAELCLSILEKYKVTNFATTPTLLRGLMAAGDDTLCRPSLHLRAISSCGEPLNSKVVETFLRVWKLTPMDHFGATEFALPIGNHNACAMEVKAGSMGLPCPGYRMAILNEEASELPVGEVGFIAKKTGPDCLYWLEYWNDPKATKELVRNGWIVTGDLGRRDLDGYFWFAGRADDMIKSSGYRIGPFEVESALLKHPAVAETAVVGIPDEMRGQLIKAYVVLKPGFVGDANLSAELVETVRSTVGRHQYPRLFEYIESLPKTETGKIQRFALRSKGKTNADL